MLNYRAAYLVNRPLNVTPKKNANVNCQPNIKYTKAYTITSGTIVKSLVEIGGAEGFAEGAVFVAGGFGAVGGGDQNRDVSVSIGRSHRQTPITRSDA